MVGHVVGLGDRHGENVLLHVLTGEVMHVDFDCLFDKGLTLARAEIVPFRLTPSMVDAMGVTGLEGPFKRAMGVALAGLRDHKALLLSVLEPFLRDPTVAWSAHKRHDFTDKENKDAEYALQAITARLNGIYNLRNPKTQRIKDAYAKRREPGPFAGLGAGKEDALPLSVPGQVQRLVEEATSEANLAQMYIGWMPWM